MCSRPSGLGTEWGSAAATHLVMVQFQAGTIGKSPEMNNEDSFPTLYLDSSCARYLNREGLYIAAETV